MRKIFTALTFALCIIFSATAFAEGAEEDVIQVAIDATDNGWYMDSTDVIIDKNSGGELIFHTNFAVILSDAGKRELVDFYRARAENVPGLDSVAMLIETVYFREAGGKIYSSTTDMLFYDKNKEVIKGLGYLDDEIEWQPIDAKTIGEIMYQTARKYAK